MPPRLRGELQQMSAGAVPTEDEDEKEKKEQDDQQPSGADQLRRSSPSGQGATVDDDRDDQADDEPANRGGEKNQGVDDSAGSSSGSSDDGGSSPVDDVKDAMAVGKGAIDGFVNPEDGGSTGREWMRDSSVLWQEYKERSNAETDEEAAANLEQDLDAIKESAADKTEGTVLDNKATDAGVWLADALVGDPVKSGVVVASGVDVEDGEIDDPTGWDYAEVGLTAATLGSGNLAKAGLKGAGKAGSKFAPTGKLDELAKRLGATGKETPWQAFPGRRGTPSTVADLKDAGRISTDSRTSRIISDLSTTGATTVDDLTGAGAKTIDDLAETGTKTVDDLAETGAKTADDLPWKTGAAAATGAGVAYGLTNGDGDIFNFGDTGGDGNGDGGGSDDPDGDDGDVTEGGTQPPFITTDDRDGGDGDGGDGGDGDDSVEWSEPTTVDTEKDCTIYRQEAPGGRLRFFVIVAAGALDQSAKVVEFGKEAALSDLPSHDTLSDARKVCDQYHSEGDDEGGNDDGESDDGDGWTEWHTLRKADPWTVWARSNTDQQAVEFLIAGLVEDGSDVYLAPDGKVVDEAHTYTSSTAVDEALAAYKARERNDDTDDENRPTGDTPARTTVADSAADGKGGGGSNDLMDRLKGRPASLAATGTVLVVVSIVAWYYYGENEL